MTDQLQIINRLLKTCHEKGFYLLDVQFTTHNKILMKVRKIQSELDLNICFGIQNNSTIEPCEQVSVYLKGYLSTVNQERLNHYLELTE